MINTLIHKILGGVGLLASHLRLSPLVRVFSGVKIKLDLEQFIDAKIFYTGKYEDDTHAYIKKCVKTGMIVIDVGANIGVFSLVFAKLVGSEGAVYAFEPSGWTYEKLLFNASLNDFHWLTPVRAAVGAKSEGCVDMMLPCGYRLDKRNTATPQSIEVVSLDDFVARRQINHVDFIKIDTDGWEPNVLRGAKQLLQRSMPIICFEFGPDAMKRYGFDPNDTINELESIGYNLYTDTGQCFYRDVIFQKIAKDASINLFAVHASKANVLT